MVEFVTKRIRWPAVAQLRAPRRAAPGIGSPRDVQDAVDVEQNRRHGRRVYSRDAVGKSLRFRFSRSSGPGGQHAQKSSTRVEALFDVEGSTALTDAESGGCSRRLGPVVRAIAQDERSQLRNRELATERIVEQLREAPGPARRGARRSRRAAARERRLEEKRRQSQTKRLRRPPDD